MSDFFQRTISKEEAQEGFVFILKDALGFFPIAEFEIQLGSTIRRVKVESRSCECRGPDKPHQHYVLRWGSLNEGDSVIVQKDPKKAGRFRMQIRSTNGKRMLCG